MLTQHLSLWLRLFFTVIVPSLLLGNFLIFGALINWLERHYPSHSSGLMLLWFCVLLALNVGGFKFANRRNNPYLGGLYLALLIFLICFWLFLGAASGVGSSKT